MDDVAQFDALTRIESCLKDIESWMHRNMLKLNANKTDIMLFSPSHNFKIIDIISVNIDNYFIASTSYVRYLGVMFDSHVDTGQQLNVVCRSGYGQLQKIGRIRRYLYNEATKSLLNIDFVLL